MEDLLTDFFKFQWRKNKIITIVIFIAIIAVIVVPWFKLQQHIQKSNTETAWDIYINLIASLLAFCFAAIIFYLISLVYRRHEDELKVSYKNSQMLKIYKNKYEDKKRKSFHRYRKAFPLPSLTKNAPQCIVYCDDLFFHKKQGDFSINDYSDRYFEVNTFIEAHAVQLLGAHSGSNTTNEFTPRLAIFVKASPENGNINTLTITRSTYVNHLLTNRAMDYKLGPDVSLRRLYESIDVLTELPLSKMSNHIGINALVFLTGKQGEKYLIVPRRGKNATVVKNGITASIATRLKVDKEYVDAAAKKELEQYIEEGCIKQSFERALLLTKEGLEKVKEAATIHFLGLARDPYEGGKPTLFYYVDLNLDINTFKTLVNKDYKAEDIDEIKELMLVEWDKIIMKVPCPTLYQKWRIWKDNSDETRDLVEAQRYDKAELKLEGAKRIKKGEIKCKLCKSFIFEQNLITNFWFYLKHTGEIE